MSKIEQTKKLNQVIQSFGFSKNKNKLPACVVSVAVIDLKTGEKFGYNENQFIYPASLYKIYIAAEVLRQAESKKIDLTKKITISKMNAVDKKKEVAGDKRALLSAGSSVSINYLLNLMITRSDNTAANCLIDLVDRENINKNIIKKYAWQGSEVTRKFLQRNLEDEKYKDAQITVTCARHVAEFLYLVENEKLISKKMSRKLKKLLGQSLTAHKNPIYTPKGAKVYRKDGWLKVKSGNRNIVRWNSVGAIIESKNKKYIISIISVLKSKDIKTKFPLKRLAKEIYNLV